MINLDEIAKKYKIKWFEEIPMLKSQEQIQDEDGKLQRLNIDITDRCNYSCLKCFRGDEIGMDKNEMDFDLLKKIIDEALELGVEEIGLHGGEPTIYQRFDDLMVYLREIRRTNETFFVTMFTNGSNLSLTDKRRDLLKQNRFLEIYFSIETFEPDNYQKRSRCPKNSFNKVMQNLEMALSDGLAEEKRLALTYTLSKDNQKYAREVWKFCRDTGIIPRFTFLVDEGNASDYLSHDQLTDQEKTSLKEMIIMYDKELGHTPLVSRRAIGIKHFQAFNMLGIDSYGKTNYFNKTIPGLDISEI